VVVVVVVVCGGGGGVGGVVVVVAVVVVYTARLRYCTFADPDALSFLQQQGGLHPCTLHWVLQACTVPWHALCTVQRINSAASGFGFIFVEESSPP
jgi:hypothetical protein